MNWIEISQNASNWIFLGLVLAILWVAHLRGVKVYDTFIEGAKEGFEVAIKIVPYLVAMWVAIGMFRASGGVQYISDWMAPVLSYLHVPADVLPLILVRPFSGSATLGLLAEVVHHHGGDAYVSKLAATLLGSTETTFYIVAVYFGVVRVTKTRYAIPAGLIADLTGVIASIWICRIVFL